MKLALKILTQCDIKDKAHEAAQGASAEIIGILKSSVKESVLTLFDIFSVKENYYYII